MPGNPGFEMEELPSLRIQSPEKRGFAARRERGKKRRDARAHAHSFWFYASLANATNLKCVRAATRDAGARPRARGGNPGRVSCAPAGESDERLAALSGTPGQRDTVAILGASEGEGSVAALTGGLCKSWGRERTVATLSRRFCVPNTFPCLLSLTMFISCLGENCTIQREEERTQLSMKFHQTALAGLPAYEARSESGYANERLACSVWLSENHSKRLA